MDTRNPSPPPGVDSTHERNDQIGNSAYSKRWLYSLILQVLTKMSECDEGSSESEEELEAPLEEELCCLWDITTDQALLTHLRHFQLVPVFTECIHKSHCPRLIVTEFIIYPFSFFCHIFLLFARFVCVFQ